MLKKIILQYYQMYAIGPYLYIIPYYALKKSNHLLTLYNITIIIPIFCYTEAWVTIQYSFQDFVAVGLKTQDSQLVSSQSSVVAI